MRFSSLGLLAGLAACVVAEDLLFIDSLQDKEYDEAIALGYTAKVVTETEWRAMTTADFAAFKAIVISARIAEISVKLSSWRILKPFGLLPFLET